MDDRTRAYLQNRRRRNWGPAFWLASAFGFVALIGIAWQASKNGSPAISILGASDPVDRELRKWFDEHEGEPESVEIISQERKIHQGRKLVKVRFRHRNVFGGKAVGVSVFELMPSGIEFRASEFSRGMHEYLIMAWDSFDDAHF